jgi:ubiquitin-activating enzyme E1
VITPSDASTQAVSVPTAHVAKNVILAGIKSLTLQDTRAVELRDLSAQFYLAEGDVGKNRAEACRDRLQELNTSVSVSATNAELTLELLSDYQVCNCLVG